MTDRLKRWMLPVAMITGGVGYQFFETLSPLTPYLIFTMLLITYCRVSWHEIRILPLHLWMIAIQIIGGIVIYAGLNVLGPAAVSQGAFICVLAPTATSAAVVTGMLGGSVSTLATYTLLSNIVVAGLSPVVFSVVGEHASQYSFWESFGIISRQMIPLLILPFVGAFLLEKLWPRAHRTLQNRQIISFYLWSVALMIVMGRTVSFLVHQERSHYFTEATIIGIALLICGLQFWTGHRLGRHFASTVAGTQGLGQKNTILAIWMAGIYLDPIASVGPASYVVWQNLINSWQIWRKKELGHNDQ